MATGVGTLPENSSVDLSLDAVSTASHPAIARAVEEILRAQHNSSAFSNFVSHSSAAE